MRYVREEALIRLIKRGLYGARMRCCGSCHNDADDYATEGMYQLRDIDLGKGRYTEVCCAIGSEYDEWVKTRSRNRPVLQRIKGGRG